MCRLSFQLRMSWWEHRAQTPHPLHEVHLQQHRHRWAPLAAQPRWRARCRKTLPSQARWTSLRPRGMTHCQLWRKEQRRTQKGNDPELDAFHMSENESHSIHVTNSIEFFLKTKWILIWIKLADSAEIWNTTEVSKLPWPVNNCCSSGPFENEFPTPAIECFIKRTQNQLISTGRNTDTFWWTLCQLCTHYSGFFLFKWKRQFGSTARATILQLLPNILVTRLQTRGSKSMFLSVWRFANVDWCISIWYSVVQYFWLSYVAVAPTGIGVDDKAKYMAQFFVHFEVYV